MKRFNMLKKSTAILLALALGGLTACSSEPATTQTATAGGATGGAAAVEVDSSKIQVVAATFPEYDWARTIIGDDESFQLTLLMDSGVDLHSYDPTPEDITLIATADLFLHVGGMSDGWVADVTAESTKEDQVILNLVGILGDGVKMEESVEGMEGTLPSADSSVEPHDHDEEEHDHAHDEEEAHDHDEEEAHDHDEEEHDHDEEEAHDEEEHDHDHSEEGHSHAHEDEHVWLSLRNAQAICVAYSDALTALAPDSADTFAANLEAYLAELEALDGEYVQAVADSADKTILLGDRFPFRYLVDDYNITYYAAFTGCSSETEASFETIAYLANKLDELGLDTVLTIENPSHKIAETIVENSSAKDQQILELDSMQSVSQSDIDAGTTYLSVMTSNLEVLKEVL